MVQLHFCSDQTAWRFILPALLDLPVFQFDWESCGKPQNYLPAAVLLKSSFFCPIATNADWSINCWFDFYGPENLQPRIDLIYWGETGLTIPSRPLPSLPPSLNGYVLDIQSRHPGNSLRSLLLSRGKLHPIDRERLRSILNQCAQSLDLDIKPFSTPAPFGLCI